MDRSTVVLKSSTLVLALLLALTPAPTPAGRITINAYVDNNNVLVISVFPPADATTPKAVDVRITMPPYWTASAAHTTAGVIDGFKLSHWATSVYTTPVTATFQLHPLPGASGLSTIWVRTEGIQAHAYVRAPDAHRLYFPLIQR